MDQERGLASHGLGPPPNLPVLVDGTSPTNMAEKNCWQTISGEVCGIVRCPRCVWFNRSLPRRLGTVFGNMCPSAAEGTLYPTPANVLAEES